MVKPNINESEYLEPYIYGDPSQDWTIDSFSSALTTADAGTLEYAADLGEAMWCDSRIRGVLTTRIDALLGFNNEDGLEFEAPNASVENAIKEDWFLALPEPELSKLMRWGILLGIGFAFRRVVQENGRWIPRIKVWHPRNFTWDHQIQRWKGYTVDGKQFVIEPDDPKWVLFQPFGESRPWAEGLWRTLAVYWLIANRGWRAWGKHNDVHGSAGLVGKLPEGVNTKSDNAQKFFNDLKSLAKNARIVLMKGYELDLLEASGNTWNTFDSAIEKAETAMAITVLGQPLTTEVPNAVQTGATAAIGVKQDYLEFDAEQLSTWAHDFMLPLWALWNYGDAALSPWPKFNVKPKEDVNALATRMNTAADAITKLLAAFREQIDFQALLERFDIPLKAGASFDLPPPEPPPALPGKEEAPPEENEEEETESETMSTATLASKDDDAAGLIEGQAYVDRLSGRAIDRATKAMSSDLSELLSVIDHIPEGPNWHKTMRAALLDHYGTLDDAAFTRIAERAIILAELSGRSSVLEDL